MTGYHHVMGLLPNVGVCHSTRRVPVVMVTFLGVPVGERCRRVCAPPTDRVVGGLCTVAAHPSGVCVWLLSLLACLINRQDVVFDKQRSFESFGCRQCR